MTYILEEKEEKLQESEGYYRCLFNTMTEGFALYEVMCDDSGKPRDFRFLDINLAFERLIGLQREGLIGRTHKEVFPDKDPVFIEAFSEVSLTCKKAKFEIYSPVLNVHFEVIAYSSAPCRLAVLFLDITKLKHALEENKKQNRFLKTVIAELKGNCETIEEMLYNISHDLMAPLIIIEGFLCLMKKDVEACNRTRIEIDMGLIGDAVLRMQKLLGESLELSSLGRLQMPAEDIPFKEIVEESLMHLKDNAASSNLEITADEDFPSVHVDRGRMVDVLMSLIDVCIRCSAVGQESRILIGHKKEDAGTIFFITRKGTHADVNNQSQVECLCSGEEVEDYGTSLGLSVSKRIIETHGGRMWTECRPDESSIYFTLPEAKNVQEED